MNFFSDLWDSAKRKQAELKERREFLDMVESKARPIRRAAYMQQMLKEVVEEGKQKAIADAAKKKQALNPTKKEEDFGISLQKGVDDPYRFMRTKSEDKKDG